MPKCDFCPNDAEWDSPVRGHSSWAYMCSNCYDRLGTSIGTRLKVEREQKPSTGEVVMGLDSFDEALEDGDMEYMCEAFEDREITCPKCGDTRSVEPDANYTYLCSCGVTVQVPEPII